MKRRLLGATALVAVPALLAGCSVASSTAASTVQSIFSAIQFVMPLLDVMAIGISVAVPALAPIVAAVEPYLTSAGAVFQTMSATMTQVAAEPIAGQIAGYVTGAATAVNNVVNAPGAPAALAAFAPKVAQAQAVVGLLTAFASGVSAMPTSATVPLPIWLHK